MNGQTIQNDAKDGRDNSVNFLIDSYDLLNDSMSDPFGRVKLPKTV